MSINLAAYSIVESKLWFGMIKGDNMNAKEG